MMADIWQAPLDDALDFLLAGLAEDGAAGRIMIQAAAGNSHSVATIREMEQKIPPDFVNSYGITPLMAAAARGHAPIVDYIAGHPLTFVNRADHNGWTALHYAAKANNAAAIKSLLRHKADASLLTADGRTAMELSGREDIQDLLRHKKGGKHGVKNQFPALPPANDTHSKSKTALAGPASMTALIDTFMATAEKDFETQLRHHEKTLTKDQWHSLFIGMACRNRPDFIKAWHKFRPLPDEKTLGEALDAVLLDAEGNATGTVRELMWMGADPFRKNEKGTSPVWAAASIGKLDCMEEMIVFSKRVPTRKELDALELKWKNEIAPHQADHFADIIQFGHSRTLIARTSHDYLIDNLYSKAADSTERDVLLLYLESRKSYMFRPSLLSAQNSQGAFRDMHMAAYFNGWHRLIDVMERDGHTLAGQQRHGIYQTITANPANYPLSERLQSQVEGTYVVEPFLSYREREKLIMRELAKKRPVFVTRYGIGGPYG